jgi:pilus biogenesis lipoprotein CpaD
MSNRLFPTILISLSLALLNACAANLADYDPEVKYRPEIEQRMALLVLDTNEKESRELPRFVTDYSQRGYGNLSVLVIGKSENDQEAIDRARRLGDKLARQGVSGDSIELRMAVENAEPTPRHPVLMFVYHVAKAPECGVWEKGFTADNANKNTDNFGCSVHRNRQLMAADPRDLLEAKALTARDGGRAYDIFDKYRRGVAIGGVKEATTQPTSSSKIGE